jgi:hypothetical protein
LEKLFCLVDKGSEKIVILALKTTIMATIIKKVTTKQEAKRILDEAVANAGKKDLRKYAGILKTDIDPLEYQKKVRNEWE